MIPSFARNNATQLCEPCQVVGCQRCASKEIGDADARRMP